MTPLEAPTGGRGKKRGREHTTGRTITRGFTKKTVPCYWRRETNKQGQAPRGRWRGRKKKYHRGTILTPRTPPPPPQKKKIDPLRSFPSTLDPPLPPHRQ